MTKERPIIFNPEMVRAILDGKKTQTRRIVKPQPTEDFANVFSWRGYAWPGNKIYGDDDDYESDCDHDYIDMFNQIGKIGDRLWVKETFWQELSLVTTPSSETESYRLSSFNYELSNRPENGNWEKRPSIHMPRKASRILLEITNVRVERVQDISEQDAELEGIGFMRSIPDADETLSNKILFEILWNSIYKNWSENPWVWVVEFKVIEVKQ